MTAPLIAPTLFDKGAMLDSGATALPSPPRYTADVLADALDRPRPTPEQRRIIEAPLTSALVVAGAGSGKTETMTSRVVWLVANGLVAPDEVLGLTFTRKAAGELADRVARRLRRLDRAGLLPATGEAMDAVVFAVPTISTYHAYAGRLVAEHGMRLGIEPHARLLSEAAAWQLAHDVVTSYDGPMDGVEAAESTVTAAVLALSGELSEHLRVVAEVTAFHERLEEHIRALPAGSGPGRAALPAPARDLLTLSASRRLILPIVTAYATRKRERDCLDFADQMALAASLVQRFPHIVLAERARFGIVLLDEFQDTSEAQLVLLQTLFAAPNAGNVGNVGMVGNVGEVIPVTAVGDPHQSIYGWRGASATTLSRFPILFGSGGRPSPVFPLTTSWRNDDAILAVANRTAGPLREVATVPIERLVPAPNAGEGLVTAARLATQEAEAAYVAEAIAHVWWDRPGGRHTGVTAAVLCRRRAQFADMVAALTERGLPVEVVGLGGLLTTPEVGDVVALLTCAHDLGRGDALMRILTGPRINLGAADLDALSAWAAVLRLRYADDAATPATILDAIDDLPTPRWTGPQGERLSEAAYTRLSWLARAIRSVRTHVGLPLPELVIEAERSLGLDIEVLVRPDVEPEAARVHLDAFADVAASFATSSDRPSLGGFLDWLTAASNEERGLDMPTVAVSDAAVQVLTVHAAKGLEWDVVAVPGLIEGVFPDAGSTRSTWSKTEWTTPPATDKGWCVGLGTLPFELRGDRDGLPSLEWLSAPDLSGLAARLKEFFQAGGRHQVAEERRLAYVAFTRARHRLLLSAPVWGDAKTPRVTSQFLRELLEVPGLVRMGEWAEMPDGEESPENPRLAAATELTWPSAADTPRRARVREAAAAVRQAMAEASAEEAAEEAGTAAPGPETPVDSELAVLLAEWRAAAEPEGSAQVALPAHVSSTQLVALRRDPVEVARRIRRPVPTPPAVEARRGTAFHAWVEAHYARATIVDVDDLPGAADDGVGSAPDLDVLKDNFLRSPWALREPVDVEVELETVVAGIALRGRVDAVFRDGDAGAVVVDWKTGRPPEGEAAQERAWQLAVYRLAYARARGLPATSVRAAFFYASTGDTVYPALPSESEVSDYLQSLVGEAPVTPARSASGAGGRPVGSGRRPRRT